MQNVEGHDRRGWAGHFFFLQSSFFNFTSHRHFFLPREAGTSSFVIRYSTFYGSIEATNIEYRTDERRTAEVPALPPGVAKWGTFSFFIHHFSILLLKENRHFIIRHSLFDILRFIFYHGSTVHQPDCPNNKAPGKCPKSSPAGMVSSTVTV